MALTEQTLGYFTERNLSNLGAGGFQPYEVNIICRNMDIPSSADPRFVV